MSFIKYYFGIGETTGREHPVLCPFPHELHDRNGSTYQETHASAHVNIDKGVFHCKSCGRGMSELQLIREIMSCSFGHSLKIQEAFNNEEDLMLWQTNCPIDEPTLILAQQLGISKPVAEQLYLYSRGNELMFPVFVYEKLVDIRHYAPGRTPKVRSRVECTSGYIVPFDLWRESDKRRITAICAGEKDMAIARTMGFNAITFTGGEQQLPLNLSEFTDREIVILYDNDDAGTVGAWKLAEYLYKVTPKIRVCTNFHSVCTEKGEDIHNYFMKYGKSKEDLTQCILTTPYVQATDFAVAKPMTLMSLRDASDARNIGQICYANVQVLSVYDEAFLTPLEVTFTKYKRLNLDRDDDQNSMHLHQVKTWELTDNNVGDLLHVVDNNFTELEINKNMRALAKVPFKESFINTKTYGKSTVFKAHVTDMFEALDKETSLMEYPAYSIKHKLESGKKYRIKFKVVPHPYKGQRLTMIILEATEANDSVSSFTVRDKQIESLKRFQEIPGSIAEKMHSLSEKVKGLLGYDGNNLLIETLDLAYHTPLYFNLGRFKNVRAYLDTLIVGESRVGKSSTAEALRLAYGLGTFTSLAGNSATVAGLVGGSNKTAAGFQTRAGLIPQNHKGLIIFEEFGKCNVNLVRELTDIRSSNEVRITRVAGSLTLPAMVRMISLSNVKSHSGEIKSIASYPNGIEIIAELVGSAEDIARYDVLLVLSDRGNSNMNPLWEPQAPMASEDYMTRVRWTWSRTPEQIVISPEIAHLLVESANMLNRSYDSHIKIFGTEAWKKLTRLAIAVAACVVSTDQTYESIVVTKECVEYAIDMMKKLYDNPTFRLKEYVEMERQYSHIDQAGIDLLQQLFLKNGPLLRFLEHAPNSNKASLMAASGVTNDEFNALMKQLLQGLFVRYHGQDIYPTERFRVGMRSVNRVTHVTRPGELVL